MLKPVPRLFSGMLLAMLMLGSFPSWSAGERSTPDFLDLAAPENVRATRSTLLAVTTAGKRLVAVGVQGIVLLSDDLGKSWRQARSVPVGLALTNVYFVNETQGWAVGHSGVILHSKDAGETWKKQLDGREVGQLLLAEAKAIRSGEEQNRAIRNAERWLQDGPDKPLLGIYFATPNRGWAVGAYGFALSTEDGGNTWQSIMERLPNKTGKHIYDLRVFGSELILAGEQGSLFKTETLDGPFELVKSPYAGTFFGSLRTQKGAYIAYGLRGNVWRRQSVTGEWGKIEYPNTVSVVAGIQLSDGRLILGDQSGRLAISDDDGFRFSLIGVPAIPGFTSLTQASDGALIATGTEGAHRIDLEQLKGEEKKWAM